jgi:hypothetical protein
MRRLKLEELRGAGGVDLSRTFCLGCPAVHKHELKNSATTILGEVLTIISAF